LGVRSFSLFLFFFNFRFVNVYLIVYDDMQLDFNQQLDDQGPIDIILHKLTDHLNRSLAHGQEATKWMDMVQVCLYS